MTEVSTPELSDEQRAELAKQTRSRRTLAVVFLIVLLLAFQVPLPWDWSGWELVGRFAIGVVFLLLIWLVVSGMVDSFLKFLALAGWAWLVAVIWLGTWLLVWIDRVSENLDLIDEPSAVALSLGLTAVIIFTALLMREETLGGGMRPAIAATFIVVFLLLIIDLLTIPEFRQSLSDVAYVQVNPTGIEGGSGDAPTDPAAQPCPSPEPTTDVASPGGTGATECVAIPEVAVSFVDGLFGVFTWAFGLIIVFYFGSEALNTFSQERTKRMYAELKLGPDGKPFDAPGSSPQEPGSGGPERGPDGEPPPPNGASPGNGIDQPSQGPESEPLPPRETSPANGIDQPGEGPEGEPVPPNDVVPDDDDDDPTLARREGVEPPTF